MAATDPLAQYRALVELAENECVLVQAGHVDELSRIQDEWTAILRTLPATPPRAAEPLLRRALALTAQAELGIQKGMIELQREMGRADRTRAMGRAYSPASGLPPQTSIDAAA